MWPLSLNFPVSITVRANLLFFIKHPDSGIPSYRSRNRQKLFFFFLRSHAVALCDGVGVCAHSLPLISISTSLSPVHSLDHCYCTETLNMSQYLISQGISCFRNSLAIIPPFHIHSTTSVSTSAECPVLLLNSSELGLVDLTPSLLWVSK